MINLLFPILCFIVILLLTEYLSYQGLLEQFSELYLAGPTKCFSCERQMINTYGPEYAWQGKQSKCFDCERQMASVDPNEGNRTHGTKCFDCEFQYLSQKIDHDS